MIGLIEWGTALVCVLLVAGLVYLGPHVRRRRVSDTCPRWETLGHNEIIIRGTCCACGHERRTA